MQTKPVPYGNMGQITSDHESICPEELFIYHEAGIGDLSHVCTLSDGRSPSPQLSAGAWAHPARGQRDILVVDGRLALEAVTERDVQPPVEISRHTLALQERPVVMHELFRGVFEPGGYLRAYRASQKRRSRTQKSDI